MLHSIDFTTELKQIIGCLLRGGQRPFVCDGHPVACQVMVVGQDPATALSEDWWSFWDTECGFNQLRFESAYTTHREQEQLEKPHRKPKSDTRGKFLDRITFNLKPKLNSLETNASMGGGTSWDSNKEVLKLLLKEMHQLQAIIAYGGKAHKLVGRRGKLRQLINLPDKAIHEIPHFTKRPRRTDAEIYAEIDYVCAEIKAEAMV